LNNEGSYWNKDLCWKRGSDVLVVGIVANYGAVAADTFSSELGILSKSKPRLITAPWRIVPPGTNGGVTITGLGAGLLGAFIIAATATLITPFCKEWSVADQAKYTVAMTLAGFSGTLLDSYLGAVLQASVIDVHSGKIVEGEGGGKVLVHSQNPLALKTTGKLRSDVSSHQEGKEGIAKSSGIDNSEKTKIAMQRAGASASVVTNGHIESRKVEVGNDVLDNNGVNFLMAASVSVGSMIAAALIWGLPLSSILPC
jgi:uncharacterized membrane protein